MILCFLVSLKTPIHQKLTETALHALDNEIHITIYFKHNHDLDLHDLFDLQRSDSPWK